MAERRLPSPGNLTLFYKKKHPNCVLFITHGGVFSQYETLHAGVPVVGIPFFGDQRYNVKYYEDLGVGVKLDFLTITEETFHTAITTVLNDTSLALIFAECIRHCHPTPLARAAAGVVTRHRSPPDQCELFQCRDATEPLALPTTPIRLRSLLRI
ncbi:UDP-glucuronosyltransferase 1-1 [Homalodisca vitripennis]|nr:UDP-glucuronosyltransferase 1-1 [Homalodisca vitripennis]